MKERYSSEGATPQILKKVIDGAAVTELSKNPQIARLLTRLKSHLATRWMLLFAFLALVSPTVINYSPYRLTWDESYYLGRVICTNHAVYDFSLSRLNECLAITRKGPIMGLVNLPWGKAGGTDRGIGLAFVGLAIFIWILALTTYLTCVRSGIPPGSLLLAAATICLTPFLRANGGAMMVDMLLGWCVALALLLIPLEYCSPSKGLGPSVFRGLLWSFVIDVGMLSKVTFAFFLCAIGIALLGIRERHSGEMPLRYAFAGCIAGSMPAIAIWRYYGMNFLGFAMMAAWGETARYWSVPGMTAGGYLRRYVSQLGLAIVPLLVLLALFARGVLIEKQMRLARLLPVGIIVIYLGIAARSQNRDPRFTIPVMLAMPLCLAWTGIKKNSAKRVGAVPILTALLLGTLFALPMTRRPQVAPINRAGELLRTLSQEQPNLGRPVNVVIATDGPEFNFDTFQLAQKIEEDTLAPVELDALVYYALNKRTADEGFQRIDAADYVLFLKPGLPPGPDWSRVYAQAYRAHCEKVGTLLDAKISPDLDVFKIRKAGIQVPSRADAPPEGSRNGVRR
jgi:hypothetical protein